MTQTATKVTTVSDQDIDAILGTGASSIMVPGEKANTKPSFFSTKIDTTFIDNPNPGASEGGAEEAEEEPGEGEGAPAGEGASAKPATPAAAATPAAKTTPAVDTSFLDKPEGADGAAEGEEEEEEGADGVPSKSTGLAKLTAAFIKKGVIVPFQNEDDLSKYKVKDYEELWDMNLKKIKEEALDETQKAFLASVSPQTRAALEYELNGGTDLKSLYQALSASEQIQELDVTTDKGQESTVRAYLQAIRYGTPDEIEEEINAYKDRGDLEKKAKQAQPKLKGMQDAVINQRLQHQAKVKEQRLEQSRQYEENVYNIIEKADLKGLPLDPDTQGLLYHGLTEATYVSASGGNTNLLGHLLEKKQWNEPDHELIAEVLWLLADRDGYHKKVKETAKKETEGKVLRTLKDAAADKKGSSAEPEDTSGGTRKTVKRDAPKRNMFGRR